MNPSFEIEGMLPMSHSGIREMRALSRGLRRPSNETALVGLLVLLNALDAITTQLGLSFGASEANTLVAGLISSVGATPTFLAKLTIVSTGAIAIWLMGRTKVLAWMAIVMSVVVLSNLTVIACC